MTFIRKFLRSRKIYFARGTVWHQPVLMYDDGVRIFSLFKSDYVPPEGKELVLAQLFNHLLETGILVKGAGIILKPVRGLGWWNRWRMKRLGLAPGEQARLFDFNGLALVVNDFFLSNAKWTPGYLVFVRNSELTTPLLTILPGIAALKNPLYISTAETSSARVGL